MSLPLHSQRLQSDDSPLNLLQQDFKVLAAGTRDGDTRRRALARIGATLTHLGAFADAEGQGQQQCESPELECVLLDGARTLSRVLRDGSVPERISAANLLSG